GGSSRAANASRTGWSNSPRSSRNAAASGGTTQRATSLGPRNEPRQDMPSGARSSSIGSIRSASGRSVAASATGRLGESGSTPAIYTPSGGFASEFASSLLHPPPHHDPRHGTPGRRSGYSARSDSESPKWARWDRPARRRTGRGTRSAHRERA